MKTETEYRLFHIPLWSIPFQILCGMLFMFFFNAEELKSLQGVLLTFLYSIVVGTPILKGYEYIEYRMEAWLPWLKSPIKRLVYTIMFQASFLSSVLVIFLLALHGILNNFDFSLMMDAFWKAVIPGVGFSILATFLANSASFFVNWKNAAVQQEVLKREKLNLEYETLKSQINPHFLFNSFTALSSLVYTNQDKAVEFIRELSNIYRYVLEQKDKELVTLEQELEFVEAVASLYRIRHDKNLSIIINVDFKEDDRIVPIALQILFENAIKHNVISDKLPLKVEIYREADWVVVKNNLQPRTSLPPSSKIGLANISRQYQMLSEQDIIVNKNETEFVVKIPIVKTRQQ